MESENNKEVPKEVRFRDELVIYERPITSKSNRSRSSTPLKEFEKFLSEWYTKKGKEVIFTYIFDYIFNSSNSIVISVACNR